MKRSAVGLIVGGVLFVLVTWTQSQAATPPSPKIPVRVVVVTTFELGADTGDTPGEFQTWVERLPLPQVLPFPAGIHVLRYNAQKHVLGIVTGGGSINSAASIMALGLDPRFDLSRAYWVLAGIAGINPRYGSIGSAVWASWVVDRDLTHEIDAREIPAGWPTGLVPLTRTQPFQGPPPEPGMFSPNAYHLNTGLVDWAFSLTADTRLADTPALQSLRAGYSDDAAAQAPPKVLKGDVLSGNTWWLGRLMNSASEDWVTYWTGGQGCSVTTAMEDAGLMRSLQLLQRTGRVDTQRVLVLRTGSNYSAPKHGQTAAELLAAEQSNDTATGLAGFRDALEAAYLVGSRPVKELAEHWDRYRDRVPGTPAH